MSLKDRIELASKIVVALINRSPDLAQTTLAETSVNLATVIIDQLESIDESRKLALMRQERMGKCNTPHPGGTDQCWLEEGHKGACEGVNGSW